MAFTSTKNKHIVYEPCGYTDREVHCFCRLKMCGTAKKKRLNLDISPHLCYTLNTYSIREIEHKFIE